MNEMSGREDKRKPAIRNHTVPIMLLRNFADASSRLWMANTKTGRVFQSSVANAFVEKGRYVTRHFRHSDADPSDRDFVKMVLRDQCERIISEIESSAAPVIVKIIKNARRGLKSQFDDNERYAVKNFILTMRRRTHEALARQVPERFSDEFLYDAIKSALIKEGIKDIPTREQFFGSSWRQKYKDLIIGNADAHYASGSFPGAEQEEVQFCRKFGLCVGVIDQQLGREFVIGSQGITEGEFKANGVSGEAILLPLAHDVVVIATPRVDTDTEVYVVMGERGSEAMESDVTADTPRGNTVAWLEEEPSEIVDDINCATGVQSQFIGGRSETVVRTFLQRVR